MISSSLDPGAFRSLSLIHHNSLNRLIHHISILVCILIISALIAPSLADENATDPARTHCVSSGYLYRIAPGMNGGEPVCMFPDKSWCDADGFYQGLCGPSLSPNIYPEYVFEGPETIASTATATATTEGLCRNAGGSMKMVHTPYGDIQMCVFPDGRTCDARAISEGRCGADQWMIYAQSWLNAP